MKSLWERLADRVERPASSRDVTRWLLGHPDCMRLALDLFELTCARRRTLASSERTEGWWKLAALDADLSTTASALRSSAAVAGLILTDYEIEAIAAPGWRAIDR